MTRTTALRLEKRFEQLCAITDNLSQLKAANRRLRHLQPKHASTMKLGELEEPDASETSQHRVSHKRGLARALNLMEPDLSSVDAQLTRNGHDPNAPHDASSALSAGDLASDRFTDPAQEHAFSSALSDGHSAASSSSQRSLPADPRARSTKRTVNFQLPTDGQSTSTSIRAAGSSTSRSGESARGDFVSKAAETDALLGMMHWDSKQEEPVEALADEKARFFEEEMSQVWDETIDMVSLSNVDAARLMSKIKARVVARTQGLSEQVGSLHQRLR